MSLEFATAALLLLRCYFAPHQKVNPMTYQLLSKKVRLEIQLSVIRALFSKRDRRVAAALAELAVHLRESEPDKAAALWAEALSIFDACGVKLPARSLGMQQIIHGVRRFQREFFPKERQLYENLSRGQHPGVLFITCSDSRIETSHITQLQPGELFVLRHVGNIVPCHHVRCSGSIDRICRKGDRC